MFILLLRNTMPLWIDITIIFSSSSFASDHGSKHKAGHKGEQENEQFTPDIKFSKETQACIACHSQISPGIVKDWLSSRHSKINPSDALKKPVLERRISTVNPPENMSHYAVGCFECHSQNPVK